jgi:predicted DNA-binding transcriptional regulator AlpA
MRTVRLIEIAELLGITKQRAHQLAEKKGFPAPLAEDGRGRLWDRCEVTAWAKVWRREKPGADPTPSRESTLPWASVRGCIWTGTPHARRQYEGVA